MLTDAEKTHLDEHGFVLLENAITTAQADALRERSMALAEQEREVLGEHVYLDDKAQRVWNLVDKDELFENAVQYPRMLNGIEYLLGEDCTLSSFTVNIIGPGAPDGGLHIDHPLSGMPTPRPSFALSANSVWFLDDFTLENGATRCVPGSHRRLESRPEPGVSYDDELQITGSERFCDDYQRIPVARLIREPHRSRSRLPARFLLSCFYEAAARSAENRF